jgi:hypothetical protein
VALSGTNAGDCSTPANACRTVQYAVDQADTGDQIRIATGVYTGVLGRPAPAGYVGSAVVSQVLYLSQTISVRGGYTTTDGFVGPPNPISYPTVLDAQGQGRALFIADAISPTVEGLGLTGGDATGLGGNGGGAYIVTATAIFTQTEVFGNIASRGAGLYLDKSNAVLDDNQIHNNSASLRGGGLYLHRSDARIDGGSITDNAANFETAGEFWPTPAAGCVAQ